MDNFKFEVKNHPDRFKVQVVTSKGVKIFESLHEAHKEYPTLDPQHNSADFTWAMFGGYDGGKPIMRFEDWETERALTD